MTLQEALKKNGGAIHPDFKRGFRVYQDLADGKYKIYHPTLLKGFDVLKYATVEELLDDNWQPQKL